LTPNTIPYKKVAFIGLIILNVILSACNLSAAEPPLPTIVPVAVTPAEHPTATSAPLPNPTATSTLEATEASQAGSLADAPEETSTPGPTATPTQVVAPTETLAPTPTETPVSAPPLDAITLKLIPVAGGLTKPVHLTHAGDGSGRLFVVEQAGRIVILKGGAVNPAPFLDIIFRVGSDANEQGLLSVAFHPNYPHNGFFYVNYTNKQGDTVIARYQVTANPDLADPNSEKILMTIGQPHANHNGGQIAFGPDGYLYIGMGDGGAANDPQNRAQNLGELLGKILRIDVNNGEPYGVPETNPFVGNEQARPEIWSYGWRNPWRFSFDLQTDDLYVADVGQNQYEEVHVQWAGVSGQNFGWRIMEGAHCFNPQNCDPQALGLELPVAEYDHSQGCSITGGYVYRGTRFPDLNGLYFYGDYCSGIIWGLRYEADNTWSHIQFMQSNHSISSFGQDEAGEVYLVDIRGNILLLGN
jgi:glucose/arabinose dehydrogenase